MMNSFLGPLVRKLEYCRPLDARDREALPALPHEVKIVEPGAYLVREGDRPTRCAVLLSGFVYRHKIVASGGRQILSLHMRGDLVDLQNSFLGMADHNVQALTGARSPSSRPARSSSWRSRGRRSARRCGSIPWSMRRSFANGSPMSGAATRAPGSRMCCASSRCGSKPRVSAAISVGNCR